jgi:hypothetical protein
LVPPDRSYAPAATRTRPAATTAPPPPSAVFLIANLRIMHRTPAALVPDETILEIVIRIRIIWNSLGGELESRRVGTMT